MFRTSLRDRASPLLALRQLKGGVQELQRAVEAALADLPCSNPTSGTPAALSPTLKALLADAARDGRMGCEELCALLLKDPVISPLLTAAGLDGVAIGDVNIVDEDYLRRYCKDLTEEARIDRLDPVLGRDAELQSMIRILCRRRKNNPLLVGDPGVGKTAIVEGLAQLIASGKAPACFGSRLLALDLGALVGGAKYRGDFEERLKKVLDLCQGEILFIDEVHLLAGAGQMSGAMDAANLLKPMLARGEIKCIGATTAEECSKYIESDAALERRFQRVAIAEPSVETTIEILRGLKDKYATFHGVTIQDAALVDAAALSARYVTSRFLPDKAVDLLDEACSVVKIGLESVPEVLQRLHDKRSRLKTKNAAALTSELDDLNRQVAALEARWHTEKMMQEEIRQLMQRQEDTKTRIRRAHMARNQRLSEELALDALPSIEQRLSELLEKQDALGGGALSSAVVTTAEIAQVVSSSTGIPVARLSQTEKSRLLNLPNRLGSRIVGQTRAITAIVEAVTRNRAGIARPNKPIGSFLLLGPTGVGKTELCKSIATELFGSETKLIRLDMSEYMESHSVSRLVGSPPGYVGHDDGGQLTDAVKRTPYSLVLLDEVEKAHKSVWNLFLQVLDEGCLTDSKGRTVDFTNCLICFTSNLGASRLEEGLSPSERDEHVTAEVKSFFRPEFVNRLDDIVVFDSLSLEDLKRVALLHMQQLNERMAERRIKLRISNAALEHIVRAAYQPAFGARPIKRYIEKHLVTDLARMLLSRDLEGQEMICRCKNDALEWMVKG